MSRLPPPAAAAASLGEAAVVIGGGRARIWLVRAGDTVAVYAAVRDEALSGADELVIGLDQAGDAASSPAHDDFQWRIRRVLDSSVVSRGREGRWAPPRDDPDWRLGAERSGGGWEVDAAEVVGGWCVVLRLHAAFFAGEAGRRPAMAFRVYDGEPGGWYAWPRERPGAHPSEVEHIPARWIPVAPLSP
ncbi:MAG TPA: hypothetical protein VFT84_00075 [Gemmatimonadales bacterium]|nr:hypothetical protein [Gemmatimonadales bacterium]